MNSRTGRALIAIRDHPIAASAMGINVALYKSLTFGVSALYTGVAGALGAIAISFVAPDSFTFVLSVALFVGLVVGGVASIPGTIVAGFFVLFVPNIAEHFSKGLAGAVYGVILLLVIYMMPAGFAGLDAPDHQPNGATWPLNGRPAAADGYQRRDWKLEDVLGFNTTPRRRLQRRRKECT